MNTVIQLHPVTAAPDGQRVVLYSKSTGESTMGQVKFQNLGGYETEEDKYIGPISHFAYLLFQGGRV